MNSYISDALYRKLREIAFLNLWDECLIIAQEISVERKIPESIKLDVSIFDDGKDFLSRSENKFFWKNLQAYVCQQVCLSIEKGELEQVLKRRKPITKHQDRHAVNREQILGAAMSVIARYPSQSKNKQGKIEATKVRILIEEKALLFWNEDGEPPLKSESIEKLIREWLNKTA